MKTRLPLLPIFAALVVSGCGQKDSAPAAAAPAAAKAAAPAPAAGPRVIEITANDTMKYIIGDKQSDPAGGLKIEVKAGEQIKVVLTNTGQLPKEAMGHNWVLLKAGTDVMAFATAGATARESDYVAPALKEQVLASIPLLGPRKSGEVVFTVPAAGEYPFLCTFPAHFAVGMKGTLVAK